MSKRAVLYARVSGDDRGNDGRNLTGQLEMCRNYASERGYEIVDTLPENDRGASGAEIDLPQLGKVRDLAREGAFDVLVVREIDRLSRNLAKQLIIEQELARAGVTVEYVIGEIERALSDGTRVWLLAQGKPEGPRWEVDKHFFAALREHGVDVQLQDSWLGLALLVHARQHPASPYGDP